MEPVFILCNVAHETAGSLESHLAEAGVDVRYFDLPREVPRPLPLAQAAGLVVMGGPMSVHNVDQYPFLAAEVAWLQEAVAQQLPTLGICLGAQLLAKAMGARVYPSGTKEIGWYRLDVLPAAGEDRLFAGCQPSETVFQWHGDTFDLPPGALPLAQGAACRQQAFRAGPSAWGLQFHVEMTPEMLDLWLDEPGNRDELSHLDYIDPAAIRAAVPREFPQMEQLGRHLLSRFAAICARHRAEGA